METPATSAKSQYTELPTVEPKYCQPEGKFQFRNQNITQQEGRQSLIT